MIPAVGGILMLANFERFIDWVRIRSPQAKTWRDYRCDLRLFMNLIQDRDLRDIHPQDVDSFVNFQVSKGYKPSTVNRRLAAVTSFFSFLKKEDREVTCPVLPKRHYLQ